MASETASTFCDVCQKHFSGWTPYQEHNDSPAHRKAVENCRQIENLAKTLKNPSSSLDEVNLEHLDEFMITEDKNLYFCKLCQVPCSGKIPALNHCLGKSHRKQKQRHQFSMSSAGQALSGSSLKLSDSESLGGSLPGMINANTSSLHVPVSSNNSATNSELLSEFSVFQTNALTGHFFCTVCNLSVSGVIPAQQHIKGKAHLKKAKRKSALKSLLDESSGNSSDLESQFSRLDVSDSAHEADNFTEEEEKLINSKKDSKLQENPLSSTLNKLHDDLSIKGDDQTSAHSINGGRVDEGELELDKVTGHWKCKVCDVTLTGEEPIKQHLVGKPHQKKKKAAGIDRGCSQWSSLVSTDFSLPADGSLPPSLHESKEGMPKKVPSVVAQSPCLSQSRATTELPRNPDGSPAGSQGLPYMVQQHAMEAAGGVSSYSHHQKSEATKDALAKGNLELAKELSSPSPLGTKVASPYGHKGVRSNPPMSDFLQHQSTAGMRSDMGNFWSMQPSPSGVHNPNSPQADSGTTKTNTAKQMDPIGTPPHITKSGGQGATPKMQGQDPIKECFTIVPSTGKLLCRVCDVSVSGTEPARQHLQGKSHMKKQRAYEFNQNHMVPFTSSPAPPQDYEVPHQMGQRGPPGLGVNLHQEGLPSNTTTQTSQQSVTSSSPHQQQTPPHYAGNMDPRHQRSPYYHPPIQQQSGFMRSPYPDQYSSKLHPMGHPPSSQSQGLHHSSRSPPPSQQNIASDRPGSFQGPVPTSNVDLLDNFSFSSSSSHHSSSQFSDDRAHSLRGVSLAENSL